MNPEIPFMQDLRNYTLHRTLPLLAHRLSMTKVNTPEQRMESEVELSVGALVQWEGWSAASKGFLASKGDAIALRPVVRRHRELVYFVNMWLHNALSRGSNEGLEELNNRVTARNALLTGVGIEEAPQLTADVTRRRSG